MRIFLYFYNDDNKLYFVESIPILLKLLEICQETQTDIKGLRQKIDLLENLVKKQKEEIQKLDTGKSFKGSSNHKNDVNWIEVFNKYLDLLVTNYIVKFK